jgi:hypothetical protein
VKLTVVQRDLRHGQGPNGRKGHSRREIAGN